MLIPQSGQMGMRVGVGGDIAEASFEAPEFVWRDDVVSVQGVVLAHWSNRFVSMTSI